MGVWGFKLFEGDHDLKIVTHLDHEAGFHELQVAAVAEAKAKANKKTNGNANATKGGAIKKQDRPIEYTMYGGGTELVAVRNRLDGGIFQLLVDKYATRCADPSNAKKYLDNPAYIFIILVACGMSVGCTIPDVVLSTTKIAYKSVGLMPDGVQQLENALNGPHGFKNGTPYDFGSLGLSEKMTANAADREGQGTSETQSSDSEAYLSAHVGGVGTLFWKGPSADACAKIKAGMGMAKDFPNGTCAGCGATKAQNGGPLSYCGNCKATCYCGKVCQKSHWYAHKHRCTPIKSV